MAPKRPSTNSFLPTPNKRSRTSKPPAPYPGGPMEIVFSFDTTGSMSGCLAAVRTKVQQIIGRLFRDMPMLRIAVIAHGDYEDRCCYVTKMHDFSANVDDLVTFVKDVGATCAAADPDECYELVLKEVSEMSWSPGSQRSLVMIGDRNPHEPSYYQLWKNRSPSTVPSQPIDWREQADNLHNMGVHIYSVHCRGESTSKFFYTDLARRTDGAYIQLSDFSNVYDMLMAICYRENGPDMFTAYEHEVRGRGTIHPEMDQMFSDLRTAASSTENQSPLPLSSLPKANTTTKKPPSRQCKKEPVYMKKNRLETKKVLVSQMRRRSQPISYNKVITRDEKSKLPLVFWSKWKRCMALSPSPSDQITRPRADGVGSKLPVLFGRFKNERACLFEFSVRLPVSSTLYVTHISAAVQKGTMPNWENVLLRARHIRDEITDVLSQGCEIFVRRAVMREIECWDDLRETRDIFSEVNDYAWQKMACGRRTHKTVVRRSYTISDSIM